MGKVKRQRGSAAAQSRQRMSFRGLVDEYQRELEPLLRSEDGDVRHRALQRTLRGYAVDNLQRFFAARRLADIDAAAIREYASRRRSDDAADVINRELMHTLVPLLRFAKERKWIAEFPKVEFLPTPTPPTTSHATSSGRYIDRLMIPRLMSGGGNWQPVSEKPQDSATAVPAVPTDPRRKQDGPAVKDVAAEFAHKYRGSSREPGSGVGSRTLRDFEKLFAADYGKRVDGKYLNRVVKEVTGQSLIPK